MVRARALDSTSFVAACDQADPLSIGAARRGTAPTGIGASLVVSPLGTIIDQLGEAPGLIVVDIDPGEADNVRVQIPVLANRRF